MQWSAQVTFDADTQEDATNAINSWTLPPGAVVTVLPMVPPVTGTVDTAGTLVPDPAPEAPTP